MKSWPYRILKRDDDDIKNDLGDIMEHFAAKDERFDTVVFVPKAGIYLSRLFAEIYNGSAKVNFVTVRRASTVSKEGFLKKIVFRKKCLSDVMRHFEVLLRLVSYKLGIKQKMVIRPEFNFEVTDKKVLVIDDSVDTGTTMRIVKSTLLEKGAQSVATACISNHLMPEKVSVDYSVYRYALLRTKNSRDYYAT